MYALSNMDGVLFLVTSQLKIVTTAFFSWMMLGKKLKPLQNGALCLLTIGAIIAQLPSTYKNGHNNYATDRHAILGLLAALLATISSGFAGIFFESCLHSKKMVEKDEEIAPVWLFNIQLALSGFFFSGFLMWYFDGSYIKEKGFFHGYNLFTFLLALLMALCGFIIAFIVKHADSIIKGFASALSVLSSGLLMDFLSSSPQTSFTISKIVGGLLVILSTLLYNYHFQIEEIYILVTKKLLIIRRL